MKKYEKIINETFQKAASDCNLKRQIQSLEAEESRARSITVGTAFGGVIEISMRSNNGSHLWVLMQPVEAIEFIHQIAAGIGCHIHIQPRKDFSSWRSWKELEGIQNVGTILPPPEQQPGLNFERKNYEPVATKKTVNRRSTKRAAAAT